MISYRGKQAAKLGLPAPPDSQPNHKRKDVIPVFGNRRAHVVALVTSILCLVVAIATTQALAGDTPQSNCLKFGKVGVCPTLNTATFLFNTATPTTASVSISVDKSYALTVLDLKAKKSHRITIRSIAPATTYNFIVKVTPKHGKPTTWSKGSFPTGAIGSVPASLTSSGNKLLLNGVPFTPIMVWGYNCATSDYVKDVIALGAKVLEEGVPIPCDSETLHTALQNQVWWYSKSSSEQEQLAALPELLEGSSGILPAYDAGSLLGCHSQSDIGLYNAVKSHSSTRPVVSTVTVSTHLDLTHLNCLSAVGAHALFWATFVAGGKGVEYYAHDNTTQGGSTIFSVLPSIPAQAQRDASELMALEPAIASGKQLSLSSGPKSSIREMAWVYGGATYVVAVNTNNSSLSSSLTLPSTRATMATVLWEGRSVKLKAATFSDNFAPLAVHVYKLVPPGPKK